MYLFASPFIFVKCRNPDLPTCWRGKVAQGRHKVSRTCMQVWHGYTWKVQRFTDLSAGEEGYFLIRKEPVEESKETVSTGKRVSKAFCSISSQGFPKGFFSPSNNNVVSHNWMAISISWEVKTIVFFVRWAMDFRSFKIFTLWYKSR